MSTKPQAIVTKLDCITGLQASRALARYGIPVIGIADDLSHFCNRTNTCKQTLTANTTNEELIDALIKTGRSLDRKAVIIPISDDSVHIISLNRNKLEEYYNFTLPEHKVLDLFMNKVKFYKFCQDNGFPIPLTFFPKNRSDLKEIANRINYPCIIKPPRADSVWWKFCRKKVLPVKDPEQLYEAYDRSLDATDAPIVQEWILGQDSNLNSCTFYYDRGHTPLITFTSRKLRQWPIEAGEISLGEEIRNQYLVEQTIELFKGVRFTGVGSLEMKLNDRDGKYYIMEANVCRLPLRCGIVEAGGVELIYTIYSEALGLNSSTNTKQRFRGVKWISLHRDYLAARSYHTRGELTLTEWLNSLKGVNTFAVLSIRDPLPFIYEMYLIIKTSLRDRIYRTGSFLYSALGKIRRKPDKP